MSREAYAVRRVTLPTAVSDDKDLAFPPGVHRLFVDFVTAAATTVWEESRVPGFNGGVTCAWTAGGFGVVLEMLCAMERRIYTDARTTLDEVPLPHLVFFFFFLTFQGIRKKAEVLALFIVY